MYLTYLSDGFRKEKNAGTMVKIRVQIESTTNVSIDSIIVVPFYVKPPDQCPRRLTRPIG
jgi:hypothetical protein